MLFNRIIGNHHKISKKTNSCLKILPIFYLLQMENKRVRYYDQFSI